MRFGRTFLTAAMILKLATTALADTVIVAGNIDGDVEKAKRVLSASKNADAIILMGDYSVRGVPGRVNYRTDSKSTKEVLSVFGKSKIPTYVLSGSNDNPEDVAAVAAKYESMTNLEDKNPTKIRDLIVLPLNGYNNRKFMFEGARFVKPSDLESYLKALSKSSPNTVSVTHISPKGDIDRIGNGMHVGEESLETVLAKEGRSSISSAIRENHGTVKKGIRWKINPGDYFAVLETDGNGQIVKVSLYSP